MNKNLGIFGLLVFICLFTTLLSSSFDSPENLVNVARRSSLYAILSIGAALVIITGGIDLSVGSVVCLVGCLLATFIMDYGWSIYFSIAVVMVIATSLGFLHGLLITKVKLQPFVVTLCGFLIYRGFTRWYCADKAMGFQQVHNDGLRQLATGQPWIGYEHNLAFLAGITGIGLVVFLIARLIWQRKHSVEGQRSTLTYILFASLVAFAGMSQFIGGKENLVLKISNYAIPLTPQSMFFHLGLVLFVPLSCLFLWSGLTARFRRNIVPILTLLGISILFSLVSYRIAPVFSELSPGSTDIRELGFLSISGGSLRIVIMFTVFLVSAALMICIGWVASCVTQSNPMGQSLLIPTVASGVIWQIGMTKLPETPTPMPLLIMIGCAIAASIFLNQTIFGRYLLALGRNEEAARYSGINTDRITILAYVICSAIAGLAAVLFALEINSMQPSTHGNIYELYAIAAAVLGGCSLRGGEGTIVGVVIGATVVRLLYNVINTLGIDTKLDWVVIGIVILAGVIVDEMVKRIVAAKRRKLQVAD